MWTVFLESERQTTCVSDMLVSYLTTLWTQLAWVIVHNSNVMTKKCIVLQGGGTAGKLVRIQERNLTMSYNTVNNCFMNCSYWQSIVTTSEKVTINIVIII